MAMKYFLSLYISPVYFPWIVMKSSVFGVRIKLDSVLDHRSKLWTLNNGTGSRYRSRFSFNFVRHPDVSFDSIWFCTLNDINELGPQTIRRRRHGEPHRVNLSLQRNFFLSYRVMHDFRYPHENSSSCDRLIYEILSETVERRTHLRISWELNETDGCGDFRQSNSLVSWVINTCRSERYSGDSAFLFLEPTNLLSLSSTILFGSVRDLLPLFNPLHSEVGIFCTCIFFLKFSIFNTELVVDLWMLLKFSLLWVSK